MKKRIHKVLAEHGYGSRRGIEELIRQNKVEVNEKNVSDFLGIKKYKFGELEPKNKIGIVTGLRGEPVEILEDSYSSEEACEHAIFLKRILDLLERHGG